jgi:6-phospho-3-hexuloisomerase
MTTATEYAQANVAELAAVVAKLDEEVLASLAEAIVSAKRVYFTGVGRSGLVARAIAMRLMHIGVPTFAVGEIATPGIAEGDLLVAVTATGRGSVLSQAQTAIKCGASVVAITTDGDNELAVTASTVVIFPIRVDVPTDQHAGSLFEQSALVIGDAICRVVQEELGVPTSELDRRHANLS